MSLKSEPSPDRLSISTQRLWVMTLITGVMLWCSLSALPGQGSGQVNNSIMAQAAALCAVLAIFGLRSVPVRWIVRGLALISGLLLARFGELGPLDGITGSWRVLLWLASLGAALVLAPSSRAVPGVVHGSTVRSHQLPDAISNSAEGLKSRVHGVEPGLEPTTVPSGQRGRTRRGAGVPTTLILAAITLVGAAGLLVGPRVANAFPTGSSAGDIIDRADNRENNSLVARDSLDMTTRPRLTNKVVMTVRSPIRTFWRTEIFDRWDGSTWTRSNPGQARFLADGNVVPSRDDIAGVRGNETTQEFRLESGYATAVPTPATPVHVESAMELAQRFEGTITAPWEAVGRGTTYTVTSRQMPITTAILAQTPRAVDAAKSNSVAADVVKRYARTTVITDRVASTARKVTADATTDFERVRALEEWMGDNTKYSLDAPLSPKGVDVVDDFLFESKVGWCEQIASSLVVMARSVGVPARLVTGFAPGDWDSVGGRFVVREHDAHAWAEVWFPGQGWVPFDPTAEVPLSGTDEAAAGAAASDWREVGGAVLLVVGLVALLASPVSRLVERVFTTLRLRRTRRQLIRARWDVAAAVRLEQIGAAAGRPREPAETMSRYSVAVADVVGDPRIGEVGVILDRVGYGPKSEAGGPIDERSVGDVTEAASGSDRTTSEVSDFVDAVIADH